MRLIHCIFSLLCYIIWWLHPSTTPRDYPILRSTKNVWSLRGCAVIVEQWLWWNTSSHLYSVVELQWTLCKLLFNILLWSQFYPRGLWLFLRYYCCWWQIINKHTWVSFNVEEALPGVGGGGPMLFVGILKRLVSVFINVSRHCRNWMKILCLCQNFRKGG